MEYRTKSIETFFSRVASILVSAFFALTLAVIISTVFFHYQYILVVGESSWPAIKYHDLIVTYPSQVQDLQVGDYVTWSRNKSDKRTYVTHKVIRIWEEDGVYKFDTQGNYNNTSDNESGFTNNELIGKVVFNSSLLGSMVAYYQGFTQIGVFNASSANRPLAIIRIFLTLGLYYTISKFASFYKFQEEFSKELY